MNASYAVHPNMKGHIGGVSSFCIGVLNSKFSKKAKLNGKSSSEVEVIGTSEYLVPHAMIWLEYFYGSTRL